MHNELYPGTNHIYKDESLAVITFLWNDGVREYLPEHVNVLAKSVKDHFKLPHRFICICDKLMEGFSQDVDVVILPKEASWLKEVKAPKHPRLPSSYRRLWAFSKQAKEYLADRVLLLDIDCLVLNDLTPLFDFKEDFVGWSPESENRTKVKSKTGIRRVAGGTWLLRTGTMSFIYDNFSKQGVQKAKNQDWRGSDQAWLSYNLAGKCKLFPDGIGIYHSQDGAKQWDVLPDNAIVVHFNGRIKPWHKEAEYRPWFCNLKGVSYDNTKQYTGNNAYRRKPIKFTEETTIACVWYKDWPGGDRELGKQYVNKLYRSLKNNTTIPFDFVCITDNEYVELDPDIKVMYQDFVNCDQSHLGKIALYNPANGFTGRVIGVDLDTIITSNIDDFLTRKEPFITRRTFKPALTAKLKDIGGDMVSFDFDKYKWLWKHLANIPTSKRKGSERWFYATVLEEKEISFWQDLLPDRYISYKRHFRVSNHKLKLLKEVSLISFHGRPRPHQINDELLKPYWHGV